MQFIARTQRSWHSCHRRVYAGNKNTPSMHHPRRRMVGLKKKSNTQKSHPKWWTPEIKLGNAEEKIWIYTLSLITCKPQGPESWRPTTGTQQTEYHEAFPSSANMQSNLTSSFTDDGNASWYWVCRVLMVEWQLDCENCRHLTVVSLHDTGPRADGD